MTPAARGPLPVVAGAALFGTIGTARALGPDDAAAPAITLVRLAVALVLLWAAALLWARPAVAAAVHSRAVLASGVAQAFFQVCFLAAVTRAGVATGTLVAIGATPLLAGLVQVAVTRRPSGTWALATGSGLVGLVLLVGLDGSADPAGVGLALVAAAAYATYIACAGAAGRAGLDPTAALPVAFTVAAALQLPALWLADWSFLATGEGWAMVAYLALVPTVLAYAVFNRGLPLVDPATAATLGLVEPVVAVVLALLVLSEQMSVVQVVGAVLVGAGVVLAARTPATYGRMAA